MRNFAFNGQSQASIAALPSRDIFTLSIERAATGEGGVRRVRGVGNSFGVMRSGRILHPAGAAEFLKKLGNGTLPLLAQHGDVSEFATIGTIERLRVDAKLGLVFEAKLADGLPLADQAWALIQQGHLRTVSVGWTPYQSRWVTASDIDLDPHVKQKMEESGATEALAFLRYDLVEISLVDVPDDANAVLMARGGGAHEIAALNARLDRIEASIAKLAYARREQFEAFLQECRPAVIEILSDIAIDPRADYGDGLLNAEQFDDDELAGQVPCRAHGRSDFGEIDELRRTVDSFGKK